MIFVVNSEGNPTRSLWLVDAEESTSFPEWFHREFKPWSEGTRHKGIRLVGSVSEVFVEHLVTSVEDFLLMFQSWNQAGQARPKWDRVLWP